MPAISDHPQTLVFGVLLVCLVAAIALAYLTRSWEAPVAAIACFPITMYYLGHPFRGRAILPAGGKVELQLGDDQTPP